MGTRNLSLAVHPLHIRQVGDNCGMTSVKLRPEVLVALTAGVGFTLSFFAWLYGMQVLAMALLGAATLYLAGSLAYLVRKALAK